MFASEIIKTGCGGVDLGLQREPQGLVVLLGDQTLLCSLLGLKLSQLNLLLTQSLLSCCCTALTGLQGALELRLGPGSIRINYNVQSGQTHTSIS